jgi:hypothetical protein
LETTADAWLGGRSTERDRKRDAGDTIAAYCFAPTLFAGRLIAA